MDSAGSKEAKATRKEAEAVDFSDSEAVKGEAGFSVSKPDSL